MAEIDESITRWLTQQAGTWRVQQRIWSSATAYPVVLPPMVAERRMVHDVFLEESMQPAAGSGQEPFTRIAYVSFNPVNGRFEHVSLDSRYPPIMFETSVDDQLDRDDTIVLFVSGFTTPAGFGEIPAGQWASQRRLLIAESADHTICRQYWTFPWSAPFLAMEYDYTRQ